MALLWPYQIMPPSKATSLNLFGGKYSQFLQGTDGRCHFDRSLNPGTSIKSKDDAQQQWCNTFVAILAMLDFHSSFFPAFHLAADASLRLGASQESDLEYWSARDSSPTTYTVMPRRQHKNWEQIFILLKGSTYRTKHQMRSSLLRGWAASAVLRVLLKGPALPQAAPSYNAPFSCRSLTHKTWNQSHLKLINQLHRNLYFQCCIFLTHT